MIHWTSLHSGCRIKYASSYDVVQPWLNMGFRRRRLLQLLLINWPCTAQGVPAFLAGQFSPKSQNRRSNNNDQPRLHAPTYFSKNDHHSNKVLIEIQITLWNHCCKSISYFKTIQNSSFPELVKGADGQHLRLLLAVRAEGRVRCWWRWIIRSDSWLLQWRLWAPLKGNQLECSRRCKQRYISILIILPPFKVKVQAQC